MLSRGEEEVGVFERADVFRTFSCGIGKGKRHTSSTHSARLC